MVNPSWISLWKSARMGGIQSARAIRAVGMAAGVLFVVTALPGFAVDAPTFRGDARHSGVYDGAGVPKLTGVKWAFHTEGRVIASPAIHGDTVYVGSTGGVLYAIDRSAGTARWKYEAKARITSSPAIAGGLIYFGAFDGNFYAVDETTGQLKWKFKTGGEHRFSATHLHGSQPATETMPDPWDCYLSSPVVWNGTVYFGSGDGNVYALDATAGTLKWQFKTGDVVHASPAIADGALFIGSWDSYFYALDAASGALKWKFKTGEDPDIHNQQGIQSSAAVMDGVVYFGCRDAHLYALDETDGPDEVVVFHQRIVGHRFARGAGWEGVLHNVGYGVAVRSRCQDGCDPVLGELQGVAAVLFPSHRGGHGLCRLDGRNAERGGPQIAGGGLDVRDRDVEEERSLAHHAGRKARLCVCVRLGLL